MTPSEKISFLRKEIERKLIPLVDRDYRVLEIPDYGNPGDVLIFEGELRFLRQNVRYKCNEMSTMASFGCRLPRIDENELLILRGGGYFGDLWPGGPAFQRKILAQYKNNPIVIFPQSVCFEDETNLRDAVKRYGEHENLTICLRDRDSYEFTRRHFPNQCFLVPDMAFYASPHHFCHSDSGKKLLIKRCDKEFCDDAVIGSISQMPGMVVCDWLTKGKNYKIEKIMAELRKHCRRGGKIYDIFTRTIYRKWQIKNAVRFLAPFSEVYSTRLHGGLLAFLMGKNVHFLNNSYGKIRSLYGTWLSDCDGIDMLN